MNVSKSSFLCCINFRELNNWLQKAIAVVFWLFRNGFTRDVIIQAFDGGLISAYDYWCITQLIGNKTQKMCFLLSHYPAHCSRKLCLALRSYMFLLLYIVIFPVFELRLKISRLWGWQHNLGIILRWYGSNRGPIFILGNKKKTIKFNMDTEMLLWLCKSLQGKNFLARLSVQRQHLAVVVSSLKLNMPVQFCLKEWW